MCKVSVHLPKPARQFVENCVYGTLASGDAKLSSIVRANADNIVMTVLGKLVNVLRSGQHTREKGAFHSYLSTMILNEVRAAHDALRAKLLPQIYTLGFLKPDVTHFE